MHSLPCLPNLFRRLQLLVLPRGLYLQTAGGTSSSRLSRATYKSNSTVTAPARVPQDFVQPLYPFPCTRRLFENWAFTGVDARLLQVCFGYGKRDQASRLCPSRAPANCCGLAQWPQIPNAEQGKIRAVVNILFVPAYALHGIHSSTF